MVNVMQRGDALALLRLLPEASEPTMTPTRSSIGSRSNCNAAPSAEMAVPPRRLTTVVQSSAEH
jgi:hypothetical protein